MWILFFYKISIMLTIWRKHLAITYYIVVYLPLLSCTVIEFINYYLTFHRIVFPSGLLTPWDRNHTSWVSFHGPQGNALHIMVWIYIFFTHNTDLLLLNTDRKRGGKKVRQGERESGREKEKTFIHLCFSRKWVIHNLY